MKKRDRQMDLWMKQKRSALEKITGEKERLVYFRKIVLPEMRELEQKEQRTWDEHRADFNLDILERGVDKEDRPLVIPRSIVEACGGYDWDDIIFSKDPTDIHQLVSDRGLCHLLKRCTDRQKELLFYIDVHECDGAKIAEAEGVDPRNVTSVHTRTLDDIRAHLLPLILLKFKLEHSLQWRSVVRERGIYTIYEERFFCAQKGNDYLEYWGHPYFEGMTFDLLPITKHFNTEPKRKKIRIRKRKSC